MADIQNIFTRMAEEAGWDTSSALLWGFFFVDTDEARLASVGHALGNAGYSLVELRPSESDEGALYQLHVERAEQHTPASLHARNVEFNVLASDAGVLEYAGWDVGPVPDHPA